MKKINIDFLNLFLEVFFKNFTSKGFKVSIFNFEKNKKDLSNGQKWSEDLLVLYFDTMNVKVLLSLKIYKRSMLIKGKINRQTIWRQVTT